MKYNKISGFSDEIASDIKTQFEVLGKLGIKYFEPRGVDGKNIADLSDDEAAALKEKMDEAGIKVSSIGSPIGKIDIKDDFAPHFALFKRVVAIAKILDTKYIRMFSFYNSTPWTEELNEEVFARLSQMLSYAKENDVILLHENEKGIYGADAPHCLELMQRFYCDNFKAVFDPANFVQEGQDTREAFKMLKPYIAYMHIKDALPEKLTANEEYFSVVPSGYGVGNVEYILKELFADGFDGFLSLEPHLGSFEGLAGLELDDKMTNLPKGGEGTFTLAFNALTDILEKI